jgi:hypothetical protein
MKICLFSEKGDINNIDEKILNSKRSILLKVKKKKPRKHKLAGLQTT